MSDWNPELYLSFQNERTRPAYDLIAHIPLENPRRILDIGCGPGNSTFALKSRFKTAEIIGIDYSETMIYAAKNKYPELQFFVRDACGELSGLGMFDLIFANASLQWMPKHASLLRRFAGMLKNGGVIAMQVPQFDRMPACRIIDETASLPEFAQFFVNFDSGMYYYPDNFYYDVLTQLFGNADMWSTEYFHVCSSHNAIIKWLSSTGMKPYIDRLPKEFQPVFISQVLNRLKTVYPQQKNGKVIFPFKRLFFISCATTARENNSRSY